MGAWLRGGQTDLLKVSLLMPAVDKVMDASSLSDTFIVFWRLVPHDVRVQLLQISWMPDICLRDTRVYDGTRVLYLLLVRKKQPLLKVGPEACQHHQHISSSVGTHINTIRDELSLLIDAPVKVFHRPVFVLAVNQEGFFALLGLLVGE